MPSMLHEALIQLFRGRPEIVPHLLRDALGVELPAFSEVRIEAADVTDLRPAQYRADLVVLLINGEPVLAIVLEVQLDRDPAKRRSWPVYVINLRARLGCSVCLLVVTPDASVARWCAEPIETGHPGFVLKPLVLGPEAVPIVTDLETALRTPELAVLSVMAHGGSEHGLAIGRLVLKAADNLDEDRKALYADISFLSVNDAARRALEAIVKGGYEYQSDFAKTYFGRGRVEGRVEGRTEGRAEAVLAVLEARNINVPEAVKSRILSCTDLDDLDHWLRRAAVATRATEIFGDASS